MRVPARLADAFGASFERLLGEFAVEKKLIPTPEDLRSRRFLTRSVVPHVRKLSDLFNRTDRLMPGQGAASRERTAGSGLTPYWKESSNPANLRLAYFLYFMPPNLFRVASVWGELGTLGFRWPKGRPLRALEFGAGPASGACGIAAGEAHSPVGLPREGSWALIEQDKAILELGAEWAGRYFGDLGLADWSTRSFHRRVDFAGDLLPSTAPRFNLWLMSFFLNEAEQPIGTIANRLLHAWRKHLDEESIIILVEPALRAQSRRLLELRSELIRRAESGEGTGIQVLLPCLGHQTCGALADPEDWCHEEVLWWRPPYFRTIDDLAELDRKSLAFSYLVLAKSRRKREEILPALAASSSLHRLVSPAHAEGQDLEFFTCGSDGKRRARYRPQNRPTPRDEPELYRGDVLADAEIRGDENASRIERFGRNLNKLTPYRGDSAR